ncbi:MAG: ATP-dependent DNA helicase RecG [Gammaproteobacteria bacterium]
MTTRSFLSSVTTLPGVGSRFKSKCEKLGIHQVQDCLFHLPTRYQDRTRIYPIRSLRPGDQPVVEGHVVSAKVMQGRRRMLHVHIQDASGSLYLRFFHFYPEQVSRMAPGVRIRCFGEIKQVGHQLEMMHPEYTLGDQTAMPEADETMTPLYPLTEGITQVSLRKIIKSALDVLTAYPLPDYIPDSFSTSRGFPSLQEALLFCHAPPPEASVEQLESRAHPAQRRLAFEELLAHHLSLLEHRAREQTRCAHPCVDTAHVLTLRESLPYRLTDAQSRVVAEISNDLSLHVPMMRLLQGDVGSGKTIVAALSMLQAVGSGFQAALMAPTELLAEQHLAHFKAWVEPLGIEIAFLSSKLTPKAKHETYQTIQSGRARIVIGTHALVQESVQFHSLALVIIDEQHRFGVDQRLALAQKGGLNIVPHQLIMTATPIPRTLAMTAYADLDVSVIDALPAGRQPITTVAIPQTRRQDVIARVHAACQEGKQAYWVCTLIEESENFDAQAAIALATSLQGSLSGVRVGLVHGKLKPAEKEAVMQAFVANEIQLLVATTVIEVGVNVPNASLMIIENPERLGLSQLHQLRGRVGRGSEKSHCVLLHDVPLSYMARERIHTMRDTQDGFVIAEKDLHLRGPGEWLGTRQTGSVVYKIADLVRDGGLIGQVKECAQILLEKHPQNIQPLIQRWLGDKTVYETI